MRLVGEKLIKENGGDARHALDANKEKLLKSVMMLRHAAVLQITGIGALLVAQNLPEATEDWHNAVVERDGARPAGDGAGAGAGDLLLAIFIPGKPARATRGGRKHWRRREDLAITGFSPNACAAAPPAVRGYDC